jgi:hypothetical protein
MSHIDPNDPLGVGKRKRGEEKDKNDEYLYYDKPKGHYKERGGCLTLYLGIGIIGSGLLLLISLILLATANSIQNELDSIQNETDIQSFAIISFMSGVFYLASYIYTWKWKKIGIYGIIMLPIIQAVTPSYVVSNPSIGGIIIAYAILYFLFHNKMHMFE